MAGPAFFVGVRLLGRGRLRGRAGLRAPEPPSSPGGRPLGRSRLRGRRPSWPAPPSGRRRLLDAGPLGAESSGPGRRFLGRRSPGRAASAAPDLGRRRPAPPRPAPPRPAPPLAALLTLTSGAFFTPGGLGRASRPSPSPWPVGGRPGGVVAFLAAGALAGASFWAGPTFCTRDAFLTPVARADGALAAGAFLPPAARPGAALSTATGAPDDVSCPSAGMSPAAAGAASLWPTARRRGARDRLAGLRARRLGPSRPADLNRSGRLSLDRRGAIHRGGLCLLPTPRLGGASAAGWISASTVSSVGPPATLAKPGRASSMPRRCGSRA